MSNLNTHISEYLEYYCDLPHPPYFAVLIKGSWGAGKTHFVDRFFASRSGSSDDNKKKHLYVSLYGVTSTREIDDALFTQLHPVLGSKKMRFASRLLKGALKASLKIDLDGDGKGDGNVSMQSPDLNLPDYLKNSNEIPIVFDDFERCSMNTSDILGYINSFVEHEGCKVIIVGDEDKFLDQADEGYSRIKEKLIGKTLEVKPEFQDAFSFFLESISHEKIKEFYKSKISDLLTLFEQSETRNLRTLQRTMWDFERFTSVLTDVHRKHDRAMSEIFGVFFAMSFELKAARITGDQIAKFGLVSWDRTEMREWEKKIIGRYPNVSFMQVLLPQGLLADVLDKSIIKKDEIHKAFDQHFYFLTPEKEETWRILWDAFKRDYDLVEKTLVKVEQQFKDRHFTITGEILHIAGIRLWLAGIGAINKSRVEVFKELLVYVDDLYKEDKLEAIDDASRFNRGFTSYGGLGFRERGSIEFEHFYTYLREKQIQVLNDSYPLLAHDLMDEMVENTGLYSNRLWLSNYDDALYSNFPILTHIEPSNFVDKVLRLKPADQYIVFSVFKQRYGQTPCAVALLVSELEWLKEVLDIFKKRVVGMDIIPRTALEEWVLTFVEPSIKVLMEVKSSSERKYMSQWF